MGCGGPSVGDGGLGAESLEGAFLLGDTDGTLHGGGGVRKEVQEGCDGGRHGRRQSKARCSEVLHELPQESIKVNNEPIYNPVSILG